MLRTHENLDVFNTLVNILYILMVNMIFIYVVIKYVMKYINNCSHISQLRRVLSFVAMQEKAKRPAMQENGCFGINFAIHL